MAEHAGELDPRARAGVDALLDLLADDRTAPTTVTARDAAERVHVADSLSGFCFPELADAERICDIGAGAGIPGLVVAAALPASRVDLVEARGRKCEFIERAIAAMGIDNASVIHSRSEEHAAGAGEAAYGLVTARAVGRLSTLAELASPLLAEGGHLLAWKGRRDPEEEAEMARASARTGMGEPQVRAVGPYAGSRHRHLHLVRKLAPTPLDLPRRPGMAKKRPFGS